MLIVANQPALDKRSACRRISATDGASWLTPRLVHRPIVLRVERPQSWRWLQKLFNLAEIDLKMGDWAYWASQRGGLVMGKLTIAGGNLSGRFFSLMNARYASVESMTKNIAILDAAALQIDRHTMEYGQYQPVLVPFDQWPAGAAAAWTKTVGNMRLNLADQLNNDPLSLDEGTNRPKTRCALLDAAIRKCFNSPKPIPFTVKVAQQAQNSPDAKVHSIELDWDYDDGLDKQPTFLTLTITCPYEDPQFKDPAIQR